MIRHLTLLCLFIIGAGPHLLAQSPSCATITFQKIYGRSDRNDWVYDIVETPDKGFITGGWGADNGDFYLMKIDQKGSIVWLRQIADDLMIRGFLKRLIRMKDGNYVAIGRSYGPDYLNTWVIKFNESGTIIWNRILSYPAGTATEASGICETSDGGLILSGGYGRDAGAGGASITKLTANGEMVWNKTCLDDFYLTGIIERNGVLYLTGGNTSLEGVILRVNASTGVAMTGLTLRIDNLPTRFYNLEEHNGLLYINGYTTSNGSFDGLKQVITILDVELNVLKMHKFKLDFDRGWEIPGMFVTKDGGFVAAEVDDRNPDLLLFKVSFDGKIEWKRKYPRAGDQRVFMIKGTSDDGIIGVATHSAESYWGSKNDIYIFKTDSVGKSENCSFEDVNAAIYTPSHRSYINQYTFQSENFLIISHTSKNIPVSIPVTTLCENKSVQVCQKIEIKGNNLHCSLSDTVEYRAIRSAGCTSAVIWKVDSEMASIISKTDTTIKLKFSKLGETKLNASLVIGCELVSTERLITVAKLAKELNLGADQSLCPGNTILLNAGTGYISYQWQDGSTNSTFTVTQPGRYHVGITDACGSIFRDTIMVTAAPPIPFSVGPNRTKCNRDTVRLSAPDGFLNYTWGNDYNISSLSAQVVTINPLVDTAYYIKAEKTPGCFAYDTVRVSVFHSPPVNLGADRRFCLGDSAVFTAGVGFSSYLWNNGQSGPSLTVKAEGHYSIMATTAEGCHSRDTVSVLQVFSPPLVTLDKNPALCFGESRTLTVGNFAAYQWSTGSTGSSLTVNTTGSYAVTVTDQNGCRGSDTTRIMTILPLPSGFLPADTAICSYGTLEVQPLSDYNRYSWSNGAMAKSITITAPGTYWLDVTDYKGCKGRDSITVLLKDCLSGFYAPNAFSPNGDGKNDVFRPLLFGRVKSYRFTVYNRWGEMVYQTTELQKGWNGKVGGILQQTDVFVWVCSFQFEGGDSRTEKGTVTVLK